METQSNLGMSQARRGEDSAIAILMRASLPVSASLGLWPLVVCYHASLTRFILDSERVHAKVQF